MTKLTDKEINFYESQKICHICKEKFCYNENNGKEFKLYQKSEIIATTQEGLEELLIVFAI